VKFSRTFLRNVFIAWAVLCGIAAYPLSVSSSEHIRCFIAGAVLSTLNVLAGYLALAYSEGKSYTIFLKAVLGGMGVRMTLMIAALLILITLFDFESGPLVIFTMGFYAVYLVMELIYIQKQAHLQNQN